MSLIPSTLLVLIPLLTLPVGAQTELRYVLRIERHGWGGGSDGPRRQDVDGTAEVSVTRGNDGLRVELLGRIGVYDKGMVGITDKNGETIVLDTERKEYWTLMSPLSAVDDVGPPFNLWVATAPTKKSDTVADMLCDEYTYEIGVDLTIPEELRDVWPNDGLPLGHGTACLARDAFRSGNLLPSRRGDALFLMFGIPSSIVDRLPLRQKLVVGGSATAVARVTSAQNEPASLPALFLPPPGFRKISPPALPR